MTLAEFLLLAQREVQMALEYLATPEARRVAPDAPAAVIATIGSLKMGIPVTYELVGRRGKRRRRLVVVMPSNCQDGEHVGRVQVDLITCPKEYG